MSTSATSPETEHSALIEFLDYQREALMAKLSGLSEEQARATPTVSSLTLLGLVAHSAAWERRWFQVVVAGHRLPGEWPEVRTVAADGDDPTFNLVDGDTIASVVARYREQIAAANEILLSADLAAPCARPELCDETVRWVALHLIEETARHAGHADILREAIDGTRGR